MRPSYFVALNCREMIDRSVKVFAFGQDHEIVIEFKAFHNHVPQADLRAASWAMSVIETGFSNSRAMSSAACLRERRRDIG